MEQITELENYVETEEYKDPFPPIENTIFYEKILPNKQLGVWTNDSHVAGENGWYNNQLSIDDIEKGYNGLTYLKGYAPQKTESMILIEQYQSEIIELKKYLSDTDYKAIKFAEGEIAESDYQEVKAQRHDARVRINELESLIEQLEKGNNTK